MHIKKSKGFSMIELLIVLAILAVIAAFAIPAYQGYILRGHRVEARQALLEATQKMQENYSITRKFNTLPDGKAVNDTTLQAWGLDVVPAGATKSNTRYTIAFSTAPSETGYVLKATAVGGQAKDTCKSFSINQSNRRTANDDPGPRDDNSIKCWNH